MTIMGIDPGENIGYAILEGGKLQSHGVIQYTFEGLDLLLSLVDTADVVVMESFMLYPGKARQQSWSKFPTVEVIGIVKYHCRNKNIPVVMQQPAIKQAFPDEKLKFLDMYTRNKHSRDAVRHALYYQRFKKERRA